MKNNKLHILLFLFFTSNYAVAQEKFDIFEIARKGTLTQIEEITIANPKTINAVNKEGYSPLTLACYHKNNEVAKFLINNGSDINQKSSMGTPLMAAVVKGNIEIVSELLHKKADVNSKDKNGTSALLYATIFKNYDIVRLLIKSNANPNSKDNKGNSAIDYAILANDDKLIEILKNKQL